MGDERVSVGDRRERSSGDSVEHRAHWLPLIFTISGADKRRVRLCSDTNCPWKVTRSEAEALSSDRPCWRDVHPDQRRHQTAEPSHQPPAPPDEQPEPIERERQREREKAQEGLRMEQEGRRAEQMERLILEDLTLHRQKGRLSFFHLLIWS